MDRDYPYLHLVLGKIIFFKIRVDFFKNIEVIYAPAFADFGSETVPYQVDSKHTSTNAEMANKNEMSKKTVHEVPEEAVKKIVNNIISINKKKVHYKQIINALISNNKNIFKIYQILFYN